jgi:hypothetical protein
MWFRFVLLFVLYALPSLFGVLEADDLIGSQPDDVSVSGENIMYNHQRQCVLATDNVTLRYKDISATANEMTFDIQNQSVSFPQSVDIGDDRTRLTVERFNYNFKTLEGRADALHGKMERLYIRTNDIDFTKTRIYMKDAQFTTCSLPEPHYLLTAKKLYLYPQFGFFVAANNWFTNQLIPAPVWVPIFVYGSHKYSILATVLPIFGANQREGFFIKHKFGYFINEKSNGTFDIGTSDNLGPMVGFNHNYIVSDQTIINTQLHTTHKEGFEGALTYFYTLKHRLKDPSDTSDSGSWLNPFTNGRKSQNTYGQFYFKTGINELVFDSRVDVAPEIAFAKTPFFMPHLKSTAQYETRISNVFEDTHDNIQHRDFVGYFSGLIRRPWVLSQKFNIDTSLAGIGYFYGKNEPWQRVFGVADFRYRLPILNPVLSYRKVFYNSGESQFDFHRIYALERDEVGLILRQRIGQIEARYEANYFLEGDGGARSKELRLTYFMHCWSLSGFYESVQSRMGFGFSFF